MEQGVSSGESRNERHKGGDRCERGLQLGNMSLLTGWHATACVNSAPKQAAQLHDYPGSEQRQHVCGSVSTLLWPLGEAGHTEFGCAYPTPPPGWLLDSKEAPSHYSGTIRDVGKSELVRGSLGL